MIRLQRTHLAIYVATLLFLMRLTITNGAFAQTITVGSTTQQLNPSERGAVAPYWPDGNMGGIVHSGTTYIFAPTTSTGSSCGGTVAISLSNLNTWSNGLGIVNDSCGNIPYGGANTFDENYAGGDAVYDDTAVSGYYFHLYHGEQHFGGSGSPSYSALGLAYSNSLTGPWTKLGEVLSPQSAWVNNGANCQADIGVGTLLVVGSYFYTYYPDTPTGCINGEQIAVARASFSAVRSAIEAGQAFTSGPGTLWMKYTGSGTWNGDGVTDLANPQNGGGAFVALATDFNGIGIYTPQVRYNSYLSQYVLAYSNFDDIVLMTSSDGLTWGNPQNIVTGEAFRQTAIFTPRCSTLLEETQKHSDRTSRCSTSIHSEIGLIRLSTAWRLARRKARTFRSPCKRTEPAAERFPARTAPLDRTPPVPRLAPARQIPAADRPLPDGPPAEALHAAERARVLNSI